MCAGVCPFLPESRRNAAGREPVPARMTKRRAESPSPFCSDPEKKRCRSVCSTGDPPVLECTALPDSVLHCRKRPSRPDPLESLPEPKKAAATGDSSLRPAAADSSGKFGEESAAEPRMQRPAEKRLGEATVMQSNDDDVTEDQLCAFNTFQFWRTPLPEVDLSLLDPQMISGDAATKDPTEAMET